MTQNGTSDCNPAVTVPSKCLPRPSGSVITDRARTVESDSDRPTQRPTSHRAGRSRCNEHPCWRCLAPPLSTPGRPINGPCRPEPAARGRPPDPPAARATRTESAGEAAVRTIAHKPKCIRHGRRHLAAGWRSQLAIQSLAGSALSGPMSAFSSTVVWKLGWNPAPLDHDKFLSGAVPGFQRTSQASLASALRYARDIDALAGSLYRQPSGPSRAVHGCQYCALRTGSR